MKSDRQYHLVILSRSFAKSTNRPLEYLEENNIEYELKRNDEPENEIRIAYLIGDADAVIVGSEKIGAIVFDKCKNLKVISKHGVGLDGIDLEGAKKRNIEVTITQNANNESVADLTWLLILATSRNILQHFLNSNNVETNWKNVSLSNEACDKTLGIIGYGKIGKAVAQRSKGFRNKVLIYDPFIENVQEEGIDIKKVELIELLTQSDIISLHAPLNPNTKHMINKETINIMKNGVIIINTSRGDLINENALYKALKNKKVKAAGIDVFSKEPPIDNPLLTLNNLYATPHIGTHSVEANYRMGMAAAQNVVEVLKKRGV